MIDTTPKPFEEVLTAQEGRQKVAAVGCDGAVGQGQDARPTVLRVVGEGSLRGAGELSFASLRNVLKNSLQEGKAL